MKRSYYGRPVIKPPVWTPEVPAYFFCGGLAGAASGLAFGARFARNPQLERGAWIAALAGIAASPPLLIADLGRPARFLNMLRVFKPTSPMSIGSWVLTGAGGAVSVAAAHELAGVFPARAARAARAGAAALGLPLATYTAALLANTAVPVWHEARRELPFVFAGSAMASAGAAAAVLTPPSAAGPARRLGLAGAVVEGVAVRAMERRLGPLAEPYREGEAARLARLAAVLVPAGTLLTATAGRRRHRLAAAGGAVTMAGALAERFAVFRAGFASARDPRHTVQHAPPNVPR